MIPDIQRKLVFVLASDLRPNPWNPNRVTKATMEKITASIKENGFVDPVTVWDTGSLPYIIIDGEHRVEAGMSIGYDEFPCILISNLTEQQAKKLTITLNELRGQPDPDTLTELLRDLSANESIEELLSTLPFSEDLLGAMLSTPIEMPPEVKPTSTWTELSFRVPTDVVPVINDALARAREGNGDLERWQALEVIAAEYLAGG